MTSVKFSVDEVEAIARLVKLQLTEREIEKFRETIPQTLGVINILKELDTARVVTTNSVTGLSNVYADDSIKTTLTQDLALSNARQTEEGLFVTKAVFG